MDGPDHDAAFLRWCARYRAKLFAAAELTTGSDSPGWRELLRQCLVLAYLEQTCRTQAEALEGISPQLHRP